MQKVVHALMIAALVFTVSACALEPEEGELSGASSEVTLREPVEPGEIDDISIQAGCSNAEIRAAQRSLSARAIGMRGQWQ